MLDSTQFQDPLYNLILDADVCRRRSVWLKDPLTLAVLSHVSTYHIRQDCRSDAGLFPVVMRHISASHERQDGGDMNRRNTGGIKTGLSEEKFGLCAPI